MRLLTYLYLFTCVELALFAQERSTNVLTPELISELAEEARTNNSALWAARARITAAQENARSIPLWRDPEVMIGGMAAETMMREEDGDLMYGIEQMLPVFGKERAERTAAAREIEVEEAELEYRFQMLRRDLAQGLFAAALADELLAIGHEDLAWLETLTSAIEQRYQAGNASQVDVLRAQNERSRRAEQIITEANRREDAYARVNRLLNRNILSAWTSLGLPGIAPAVPYSDRLVEMAWKFEPQLKKMRTEIKAAEAMVERSRKEQRPDLAAAVEGRHYSRTGEGRSASVLLKMSVPLVNRNKYKAAISRDQAKVQEIESEIEDMTYEVAAEIHHLIARLDNARREALLYQNEIIPRTELALSGAEAAWRAGREALRDVMDAGRMLAEARAMRARAIAEQYSALYELILCCGIADISMLEAIDLKEKAAP